MITGPKKLVKRAQFIADILGINPTIAMKYTSDKHFSECQEFEDGSFVILIQDWITDKHELMAIIAHEMTHVWQYFTGRLRTVRETQTYIWNDTIYKHSDDMEVYMLRPWELEARGYEEYFVYKWEHRKE